MLLVGETSSSSKTLSCVVGYFLAGGRGGFSIETDLSITLLVIDVKFSDVVEGVGSSCTIGRSALPVTEFPIGLYL